MNKPELPSIPVFKLYGESLDWPTPDLLHCETISSRSREHQWEIKPHRHADLCQLLFVFKGQAELEIEGQRTQLETPAIQVLPPLSVHGFRFSEDVEGFIVTLATPLIHHLQAQLGDAVHALAQAHAYSAGNDGDYLNSLFSALQAEYNGHQPAREMLMHALVNLNGGVISIWVTSQVDDKALMRAMEQSNDAAMREVQRQMGGLIIVGVYVLIMLALFIAGIVILVRNRKRFVFFDAPEQLEQGTGVKTALGNPGMIVFLVVGILMTISALVMSKIPAEGSFGVDDAGSATILLQMLGALIG